LAGNRLLGLTGWMPVVVAIAACAGAGGINKDSPPDVKAAVVKERAQARWEALIKGDLDTAYTFLSPASKAATSVQSYKGQIKPGLWREVKVVGVDCEAELCVAKLLLNYDVPRGPKSPKAVSGIETPLSERWVIENGSAWYVFR
jgi:hypothetical protein